MPSPSPRAVATVVCGSADATRACSRANRVTVVTRRRRRGRCPTGADQSFVRCRRNGLLTGPSASKGLWPTLPRLGHAPRGRWNAHKYSAPIDPRSASRPVNRRQRSSALPSRATGRRPSTGRRSLPRPWRDRRRPPVGKSRAKSIATRAALNGATAGSAPGGIPARYCPSASGQLRIAAARAAGVIVGLPAACCWPGGC